MCLSLWCFSGVGNARKKVGMRSEAGVGRVQKWWPGNNWWAEWAENQMQWKWEWGQQNMRMRAEGQQHHCWPITTMFSIRHDIIECSMGEMAEKLEDIRHAMTIIQGISKRSEWATLGVIAFIDSEGQAEEVMDSDSGAGGLTESDHWIRGLTNSDRWARGVRNSDRWIRGVRDSDW